MKLKEKKSIETTRACILFINTNYEKQKETKKKTRRQSEERKNKHNHSCENQSSIVAWPSYVNGCLPFVLNKCVWCTYMNTRGTCQKMNCEKQLPSAENFCDWIKGSLWDIFGKSFYWVPVGIGRIMHNWALSWHDSLSTCGSLVHRWQYFPMFTRTHFFEIIAALSPSSFYFSCVRE